MFNWSDTHPSNQLINRVLKHFNSPFVSTLYDERGDFVIILPTAWAYILDRLVVARQLSISATELGDMFSDKGTKHLGEIKHHLFLYTIPLDQRKVSPIKNVLVMEE